MWTPEPQISDLPIWDGPHLKAPISGKRALAELLFAISTYGTNTILSSTVGIDTLYRTAESIFSWTDRHDQIIEFLKGCGVRKQEIDNFVSAAGKPTPFYNAFISYSHLDKSFVQQIHKILQENEVSVFLDDHLEIGAKLDEELLYQIKSRDKLILCCSENSLRSTWVAREMNWAIYKESEVKERVVLPLDLDGFILSSNQSIADEIKGRLIADFRGWQAKPDVLDSGIKKLILSLTRARPYKS